MSNGQLSRHRSTSESSHTSKRSAHSVPPTYSAASEQRVGTFEPCTASPSFFLYAQRTIILCLHHDTLAAERRFEGHKEDVQWIAVDNVSDRGFGRLVVSYDAGQTAIVWDLFTGDQISRFAAYEPLTVATWMRNGNVAFGKIRTVVVRSTALISCQATLKAMSSCSSHRLPNISLYARFTIRSPHWLQLQICGPML